MSDGGALRGRETANLGEGCSGHLHPAFIRRVYLQVVSVGAVQPQQPTAWKPGVVSCKNTSLTNIRQYVCVVVKFCHRVESM